MTGGAYLGAAPAVAHPPGGGLPLDGGPVAGHEAVAELVGGGPPPVQQPGPRRQGAARAHGHNARDGGGHAPQPRHERGVVQLPEGPDAARQQQQVNAVREGRVQPRDVRLECLRTTGRGEGGGAFSSEGVQREGGLNVFWGLGGHL